MKRRGKNYTLAREKVEKGKAYTKEEAVKLVKEMSNTKFDGTVELAMNLNLDTKKPEQQLRGAIVLPNGTGKSKRVLVIAKGDAAKEAHIRSHLDGWQRIVRDGGGSLQRDTDRAFVELCLCANSLSDNGSAVWPKLPDMGSQRVCER